MIKRQLASPVPDNAIEQRLVSFPDGKLFTAWWSNTPGTVDNLKITVLVDGKWSTPASTVLAGVVQRRTTANVGLTCSRQTTIARPVQPHFQWLPGVLKVQRVHWHQGGRFYLSVLITVFLLILSTRAVSRMPTTIALDAVRTQA